MGYLAPIAPPPAPTVLKPYICEGCAAQVTGPRCEYCGNARTDKKKVIKVDVGKMSKVQALACIRDYKTNKGIRQ